MSTPSKLATLSPNFWFLGKENLQMVQIAAKAERALHDDPVMSLIRLRQFGEFLAKAVAARSGVYVSEHDGQSDVLRTLSYNDILTREISDLFHDLRKKGNDAVHSNVGTVGEARHQLKMARKLAVWFYRIFARNRTMRLGGFVEPVPTVSPEETLRAQIAEMKQALSDAQTQKDSLSQTVAEEAQRRQAMEAERQNLSEELEAMMELAEETEDRLQQRERELEAQLQNLQQQATQKTEAEQVEIRDRAHQEGSIEALDLDEAETRRLIDIQLNQAGWEADTENIAYNKGVRPAKGRNLAIAEWPTKSGPADYVLFAGLMPIAVVEAKRKSKDVAGALEQSKRYSRDYVVRADERLPTGNWGEFKIPFLFATNGRPFLRQLIDKSGIWFLDARRSTNLPRALEGWYTPEGLKDLLKQDHDEAEQMLDNELMDYLSLRDYQQDAIRAVEGGIANGQTELLLAMATGTGKTRTALGLIYRLIKAKRFRRILFLVDRSALGEQAEGVFKDVKIENLQSFNQIYDVKGMGDIVPDADTRLHIATVQGMVRRILYPVDTQDPIPVDRYDCIIVDESHRGYNLDREMGEGELRFRSSEEYISKYRRVLDHFDAVRIGLTATPALHTKEIFGVPVFEYTYRQAVVDGFLVDHEPPYIIQTELNQQGIHWVVGEEVVAYNTGTQEVVTYETPDEIDIEIEGFNTKVRTESFNRTVCQFLAQEIDPDLSGKTLIFCATDDHCDLVVRLLREELKAIHGDLHNDTVKKITGATDKPSQWIRHYKNERNPSIAVTVDLLTTGIDVPEITNLVFLRRVRSRILYEQMMGRATRRCDDIGKEVFRIYDAVGLYDALEDYTTMKPVVTQTRFSFSQLAAELEQVEDETHCATVIEEFLAKFHRVKGRMKGERLSDFTTLAGREVAEVVDLLKTGDVASVRSYFAERPTLAAFLDTVKPLGGRTVLVSEHEDELVDVQRGYGNAEKPEDYLEGFRAFIESSGSQIPALMVVTQRPRDLTRKQLKELKIALDQHGYTETRLRTAWAEKTNQDIAASIIGFVRQQALGSPLVSYEERVKKAMQRIYQMQRWTGVQRQWLKRIEQQLNKEFIVDRDSLDRGAFKAKGGFRIINKVFDGRLEELLGTLQEAVWEDVG